MEIEAIFAAVARRLVADHVGVEQGRIFHSSGLKTGDKFFAFLRKEDLVLKLPAPRVAELVADGTGRPFDAGRGRPMKEWVCLRPEDEEACSGSILEAHRFVSSQAKP